MAALIVFAIVMALLVGGAIGAFLRLSFAIRREDQVRGSLQLDPPDHSAQTARALVGITGSRWDQS